MGERRPSEGQQLVVTPTWSNEPRRFAFTGSPPGMACEKRCSNFSVGPSTTVSSKVSWSGASKFGGSSRSSNPRSLGCSLQPCKLACSVTRVCTAVCDGSRNSTCREGLPESHAIRESSPLSVSARRANRRVSRTRGVTALSRWLWLRNEDRCESCSAPRHGIDSDSPDLVLGEAKRARIVERSLERADRVLDRNRPPA